MAERLLAISRSKEKRNWREVVSEHFFINNGIGGQHVLTEIHGY